MLPRYVEFILLPNKISAVEKNALVDAAEWQRHINAPSESNQVKVTVKWLLSFQLPSGKQLLQRKEKFQLSWQTHSHTHCCCLTDRQEIPQSVFTSPTLQCIVSSSRISVLFYRIVQFQYKFEMYYFCFRNTWFNFIVICPCFCLFVFI